MKLVTPCRKTMLKTPMVSARNTIAHSSGAMEFMIDNSMTRSSRKKRSTRMMRKLLNARRSRRSRM